MPGHFSIAGRRFQRTLGDSRGQDDLGTAQKLQQLVKPLGRKPDIGLRDRFAAAAAARERNNNLVSDQR